MCKKILAVGFALALAVCPLLACGAKDISRETKHFKQVSEDEFRASFRPLVAHADSSPTGKDILDNTRYNPAFPPVGGSFEDYFDYFQMIGDNSDSILHTPTVEGWLKYGIFNLAVEPVKQRVIDMVNNANNHNTGGAHRPIRESYTFVAKRKLLYPNSSDYEVDYLYCWYDKNHTNNGTFEGVSLGDFYLQPNTVTLMRFNSNGYSTVAYMSADEVGLSQINSGTTAFAWYMGKYKYSVINSDGTVESLDYSTLPNYQSNPATTYFHSANDVNSIVDNSLIDFYDYSPDTYNAIFGDVLTNVQCMFTNGFDGSFSYRGSGKSSDWYISSGAFFPANGTISDYINGNFSTETNIRPKYAPVYNNFDYSTHITTGSEITTENVTNYNDYGVTYNQTSGEFELDVDALTAKIEADIVPKFQLAFDGVYNAQPAIDGSFTVNDNNYIDTVDNYVIDLINKLNPAPPWVAPTFPAVETAPLVSYTYPVLPTETVPQNVLDDVGTVTKIGFDVYDTLGTTVIATLVALAVLGAVSYYIWG